MLFSISLEIWMEKNYILTLIFIICSLILLLLNGSEIAKKVSEYKYIKFGFSIFLILLPGFSGILGGLFSLALQ